MKDRQTERQVNSGYGLRLEIVSLNVPHYSDSVAKILSLCAPMLNRNTETELWKRKKEWLYFFARQRGNTVG